MPEKVVALEQLEGVFQEDLMKLMILVPPKQKDDRNLQRLIAFRMKLDGFEVTRDYLVRKIREANKCAYEGRLYDYLKNDLEQRICQEKNAAESDTN